MKALDVRATELTESSLSISEERGAKKKFLMMEVIFFFLKKGKN